MDPNMCFVNSHPWWSKTKKHIYRLTNHCTEKNTLSPQYVPHHHRVPWGPAERMGMGGVTDTQGVEWGYPKNARFFTFFQK